MLVAVLTLGMVLVSTSGLILLIYRSHIVRLKSTFPPNVETSPAEEWREGSCKDPKRMSLDFSKMGNGIGGGNGIGAGAGGVGNGAGGGGRKLKTVASVGKELKEAKERILFLEKKLKDCGIDID